MTDWQDRYEGLAAMLLEANTILTEVWVGDHGSFVERLEALVQDCKGAQEARAVEHQALMDAHRAVTRNYPVADPKVDAGRPLAERIDALARACQRVGDDAGFVAGREGWDAAVEGLKAAYAAVAMAFPGRTEIDPKVPLEEHIQTLADACYQQGYEAGCQWQSHDQREDGAREQKAAYDRGRAETLEVCVAVLRRRGAMAPTEGGGIMLDDADYLERVVRP